MIRTLEKDKVKIYTQGKIVINENYDSIGFGAFENKTGLKKLTLPMGLTKIDKNAFKGCAALRTLKVPVTLKEIGGSGLHGLCEFVDD